MKRKVGIALVVMIAAGFYVYITYLAFFAPVYTDMTQPLWAFYTMCLLAGLLSWLFNDGWSTKEDNDNY